MIDPQQIVDLVHQGLAPSGSLVFRKKRSAIGGFFTGTSHDPDLLLVLFQEGVIHYISSKRPLTVIFFAHLSDVRLRAKASASTTSGSSFASASLDVWLDLYDLNGKKNRWSPPSGFGEMLLIVQRFIEYYALYKVYYRKP
jgi:hypothetical protein